MGTIEKFQSDNDITKLLQGIENKFYEDLVPENSRERAIYSRGWEDRAKLINNKKFRDMLLQNVLFAEGYFSIIIHRYSKHLTDFRIGFDEKMNVPTVLSVFSSQAKEFHRDLLKLNRDLERSFFKQFKIEIQFWSLVTDCPEEEEINSDFPFQRSLKQDAFF